jgi:hypothetical protein
MASQEELDRERELLNLQTQRAGIDEDILETQQNISNDLNKQIQLLGYEKAEKSEIRSLTRQINKIASESYALSLNELGTSKNLAKIAKDRQTLDSTLNRLLAQRNIFANKSGELNKGISESLDDQIRQILEIDEALKKVEDSSKNINKNFGAKAFAGIEDIAKSIPGLRQFSKPFSEAANEARKVAAAGKSGSEAFAAGAKSLARAATAALPLLLLTGLIKSLTALDKSSGQLAKNLGISYDESLSMVSSMTDVANLSMDTFVTTEGLVKAQTQLSTALGTNAQLSSTLLVDFTKLTEQAGYSAEAATVLGQVSLATGQTTKNITTEFLGQAKALNAQNGLALNEKQLLESVAKISKGTLATFAGQTDKLASAVFKAKALGLELSQVEKIADSLLDIESSLTAEFEAEVITGKQLNLERARYFALTNEIGKVAEELKNQGITQASFAKSSRIEQEAVAAAMGMSRDELGEMLLEQKAISAIGVEDAKAAREKFETLKAQYGEAEAIKRLGDETYARQLASQSTQEKFNKTVAKLQDIFVDLAAPVLAIVSPFMDLLNTVMPALNLAISAITFPIKIIAEGIRVAVDSMRSFVGLFTQAEEKVFGVKEAFGGILTITTALYGITKAYQVVTSTIQGIQLAINASKKSELGLAARRNLLESKGLVKTVGTAIFSAISSFSKIPLGLGVGLGIAAAAGIASMASKYLKGDDIMSPGEGSSGYGKRTLMGPEGAIALNNKDTVIAGTNLFPERGNDRNLQPFSTTNVTVSLSKGDIMAIANAVREGASQAKINVSLDGNAVANNLQTPMAMNTRGYSV